MTNQKVILEEHIAALEKKQLEDLQHLKMQYQITINSFSTLNLLKTSFQEVVGTPHLTSTILHGALDMGTQYLSKTFFNATPIKATGWLGKIMQFGIKKLMKKS